MKRSGKKSRGPCSDQMKHDFDYSSSLTHGATKDFHSGLINSVLKNWGCDCVFFFNYNRINMGLGNDAVEPAYERALGYEARADALRETLAGLPPQEREATIVEGLIQALRGSCWVLSTFCHSVSRTRTVLRDEPPPGIRD